LSAVVLIDYGSGNLASAAKALARVARGQEILVSNKPDDVRAAERVVLPGVGAFADCMKGLSALPGMIAALNEKIIQQGAPFLGICVGMQLMARVGREFGDHAGLGWIDGEVVKLEPSDAALKIPHMGWNDLKILKPHPVLNGIESGADAYFVHSFQMKTKPDALLATTDYGGAVTAVVGRDNLIGTQFHPEKSQTTGLKLLENFLGWKP
jgi:glutamine amidotransferase